MRSLPAWRRLVIGLVGVLVVLAVAGGGSDKKSSSTSKPGAAPSPPRVDATTLYNSVAAVFIRRYNRGVATSSQLSPDSLTFCADGASRAAFTCEMRIDVPIVSDEAWFYGVTVGASGCWSAHTVDRYGANQSVIDSYRNREALAPSAADVRRLVREANRLHTLTGCLSNVSSPPADSSPQEFIAGHAAQNVQRERPGRQRDTTCEYFGKTVVAPAPDSYDFECTTKMAAGGTYDDKISCFDPPPYTSFDSCSEEQGYPKRPPRPLP